MAMLSATFVPAYVKIVLNNEIVRVMHLMLPDYVNVPYGLDMPYIEGYHFDDYYTTLDGNTKFDFTEQISSETYSETNPLMIYGRYTKNTHTVTYDKGLGTGTMTDPNSPYEYHDTVTVLASTFTPPTKNLFKNYALVIGDSVSSVEPGDTFVIPDANAVLTAQYVPYYTVTYDANGGSGSVSDSGQYLFDDEVTVKSGESLTPASGKIFIGWNTKADGSGTSYEVGAKFNIEEDTTLYAQYADYFTVTYDANGGSGTITDSNKYLESDDVTVKSFEGMTAPEGKQFKEWNDDAEGTGETLEPGDVFSITSNITLYAIYEDVTV